ncbi:hypothetical protein BDV96DRAFT_635013 [Lophiotrema nucula]|uniref:Heterokaryon incompatibility domain-containing protein n=1 Tax=Lophiotrema nucula TaxID=690887 RepID=A0A6A5YXI2_9PLEO|nr:hypothetical protein BDV96DRAFT_635013 [Lophiotrema nucula]
MDVRRRNQRQLRSHGCCPVHIQWESGRRGMSKQSVGCIKSTFQPPHPTPFNNTHRPEDPGSICVTLRRDANTLLPTSSALVQILGTKGTSTSAAPQAPISFAGFPYAMRLLNTRTLRLTEFIDDERPPYAILSHTWGKAGVSFQERIGVVPESVTFRFFAEARISLIRYS